MKVRIGEVEVTTIKETDLHGLSSLIPEATPDAVKQIGWLAPCFADETGEMFGVIQAFVVKTPDKTIVVDTCVGDNKDRFLVEEWNAMQSGFLQRFEEAGFRTKDVDYVLCTHLHVDHVGWNTRWDGNCWVPTFPNAKYLFAEEEYRFWENAREKAAPDLTQLSGDLERGLATFDLEQRRVHEDSIRPVIDAGLVELVSGDHKIDDCIALRPTPGHTPGHVSVEIRSDDKRALITGDCFHHPCQIAHPEWATLVDVDQNQGTETRRQLLHEFSENNGVILGSHFSEPVGGHIVHKDGNYRLVLLDD